MKIEQLQNYGNKYQKWYYHIVERARTRKCSGYMEKHHIFPKCMGGLDIQQNFVKLTPEEHYVCHQLLVKMYPWVDGLIYAAQMMCRDRPNNKLYGWIRRRVSKSRLGKQLTAEHRENIGLGVVGKTLGRKMSDEAKAKMSAAKHGKKLSEEHKQKLKEASNKVRKPLSDETKKKIADAHRGKIRGPRSLETKQKISESNKGKHSREFSEEHKQKLRDAAKNRKLQSTIQEV